VDRISYGEARLYQGELIRCQSDHDDYACSRGGVVMLGGDGDGFKYLSTCCQVHMDACGYVLSYMTLNGVASRGPGSSGAYSILKGPLGMIAGVSGPCRARARG
jgi:hypothetical protein